MPETKRAFALKERYAEDFNGASMAFGPEGETVDIGELLAEGGGVIETSDPLLASALDDHEALKSATHAAAEEAQETVEVDDDLAELTKDELLAAAEDEGVDAPARATKGELRAAIRAARAEGAEGSDR